MSNDYWTICVEESLSEAGIEASPEQLSKLTDLIRNAGEMELEASGVYEIHRPSRIEAPKQGWAAPHNTGTRAYMDGSPPDETWMILDRDTGHGFYFNSERQAKEFYDRNRP